MAIGCRRGVREDDEHMTTNRTITVRISTRSFTICLALLLVVASLVYLNGVLVVMALAFMIATALGPAVRYFEQRLKIARPIAVVMAFLLLLGALSLFAMIVIPTLVDQARTLATGLPAYGIKLRTTYAWLRVFDARFSWLPTPAALTTLIQSRISSWGESGLGLAGKLFGAMFLVFIVLISAFYILMDSDRLKTGFLKLLPEQHRGIMGAQIDPIGRKIGAYVRGVMTSITILVLYLAIALTIAQEPLSLVLALLAGCFEIIPTLGPVLGAIPAILVALTVSWQLALVVCGIFVAGVFVQSNFVAPMLYSREVEVSPLLITVALLIGGELMGVVGAMIAVPVLAVTMVLVENLYIEPREAALKAKLLATRPAEPEGIFPS
jgi:predicted PurR-regulated permease PerM